MKKIYIIILISSFYSCKNKECKKDKFILTTIENNVICSIKCTFQDTLFFESRYADSTSYSYALLTKKQNQDLKNLVTSFKIEDSSNKLVLSQGELGFLIGSEEAKYYTTSGLKNYDKSEIIFSLLRDLNDQPIRIDTAKNFWHFENIHAPINSGKGNQIFKIVFNK